MYLLLLIVLAVCAGLPVLYVLWRITFLAYFNSKLDYEKRAKHGT